jgi:hypothetical protein
MSFFPLASSFLWWGLAIWQHSEIDVSCVVNSQLKSLLSGTFF